MCGHVRGSQRWVAVVFLNSSPPYCSRQGLSTEWEAQHFRKIGWAASSRDPPVSFLLKGSGCGFKRPTEMDLVGKEIITKAMER